MLSGINQIFIGASNKTTNISGNTTMLGDLNVSSGIINASNFKMYSTKSEVNQSVWLDTIGGTLNQEFIIGYNNASHLYLGGPNSTFIQIGGDKGIVAIANGGLSATGKVNIATGGNVAGSEINIGGGSSTINLYRPLTPNYGYPVGSGKIGEIINGTYAPAAGAFFTYSNPIVYSSITLSQVGVYIFQGNLLVITNNSSITNITWISVDISISGGAVLSNEQRLNQVPPAHGYGFIMATNAIVYNTGVTTYNISINTNFTGGNPYPNGDFFIYKAVRIA